MDGTKNVDGEAQLEGQQACGWMGLIGGSGGGRDEDTERLNNEYKVFDEEEIAEVRSRVSPCSVANFEELQSRSAMSCTSVDLCSRWEFVCLVCMVQVGCSEG